MDMQINKGVHIVGEFVNTNVDTAGEFKNYEIAVVTQTWRDRFDQEQREVVVVNMPYQEEDRVERECQSLKPGELVMIEVRPKHGNARKTGNSYLLWNMAKGSSVRSLSKSTVKTASAA